jgi:D-alanyl-D-alanine endopeptidase (penicillin-binding protein 7)
MRRAVLGSLIFFMVFLLQISAAAAAEGKAGASHKSHKSDKKKSRTVRKTTLTAAAKKNPANIRRRSGKRKAASSRRAAKPVALRATRKPAHRRVAHRAVSARPALLSAGDLAGLNLAGDPLKLSSNVAFALEESTSRVLFEKNSDVALPIASITKLMTALVVLEANQDMNEMLEVTEDDIDREKHTSSRLHVGAKLTRADMLHIALMSSENRAASALGRNYPGGLSACIRAMNARARALGMSDTRYVEPTGLSSMNVASARDLAKLVIAAYRHPLLAQYSTNDRYAVDTGVHTLQYVNSNRLIGNADWDIALQKTGYIREAGRCMVMRVRIEGRPVVMVFLDSDSSSSRVADASRVRKWVTEEIDTEPALQAKSEEQQG